MIYILAFYFVFVRLLHYMKTMYLDKIQCSQFMRSVNAYSWSFLFALQGSCLCPRGVGLTVIFLCLPDVVLKPVTLQCLQPLHHAEGWGQGVNHTGCHGNNNLTCILLVILPATYCNSFLLLYGFIYIYSHFINRG